VLTDETAGTRTQGSFFSRLSSAGFAAVTSAKLPWLLAAIAGFSFLLLVLAFAAC
jgi:hypothetical protein